MDKRKIQTLQYLRFLREVLFDIFSENVDDVNQKEVLKNNFLNEFTDYQILFLTKYGKLPKAKKSFIGEQFLIENLKIFLIKNCNFLDEYIGSSNVNILLDSLIPLGNYNLSSSTNFLMEIRKNKNILLNEQVQRQQQQQQPSYAWRTDPETGDKILVNLQTGQVVKRVGKDTSADELEKIMNRVMRLSSAVSSATMLYNTGKNVVTGTYNAGKTLYDYAKKAGTSALSAGRFLVSKVGAANLGYAALVATLLYGATKTYKNYISKEGRVCRNYNGSQREECIRNYRANAIRAQISDLKSSMNACNKTSNPVKCKMVIQNKIKQLQNKLVTINQ